MVGHEWRLTNEIRIKAEAYYQYLYDVPVWGTDTTSNQYLRSFSLLNSFEGWTSDDLANEGTVGIMEWSSPLRSSSPKVIIS